MTAEEFKQARIDLKMTQKKLAEELGFSDPVSISHMETGFREVSPRTAKAIMLLKKNVKKRK